MAKKNAMTSDDLFQNYIKGIYKLIERGDAREESFYPVLKDLIEAYGQSLKKKTEVTVLPKKSEAGNPDFRVWDGESAITGYIEAKHPRERNLEYIESSKQLKRYREAYPNLILTNFLEFRLYRNGEYQKEVKIADYNLAKAIPEHPTIIHKEKFIELLNLFFDFTQPRIKTLEELAIVLSRKAKIMRDYIILPSLLEEPYFSDLYDSFKTYLLKGLKQEEFADLFAQTFTYGLFIAKYQYEVERNLPARGKQQLPFTTKTAYDFIQKNFGILRDVFKVISTGEMPKNLEIIVDDIIDVLNNTDIQGLVRRNSNTKNKDPIYHLYETFLFNYDRERKKKLGVYYTPPQVVSFIVNSVHSILKDPSLFQAQDGLATYQTGDLKNSITLLDPAVGTGTFFVEAIEKAIEEVKNKYSPDDYFIKQFIRNHILKHFFAFEILVAPYVVAHLKTLFTLAKYGFQLTENDTLNIFLTNTLEFHGEDIKSPGLFEKSLVEEQEKALKVKKQTPILIIIGNPPYSVSSQNEVDPTTEFGKFYESYKEKVRKEEKNIQPLSDDYIKFIAFAHWKIKQTGKGIVAMITNNSYLDGLIHRDMRRKLLEDFDLIYILNLHGDTKRPKTTKDGKKDENVFDIQQGVAIGIFVKPEKPCEKQVFYHELIGQREEKYKFLDNHNVSDTKWEKLNPDEPYWFFVPKEFDLENKYKNFVAINEMFYKTSSGIKTHRDHFIIGFTEEEIKTRLRIFMSDLGEDLIKEMLSLEDTRDWKFKNAREKLKQTDIEDKNFFTYLWRPFDFRKIYYSKILIELPRLEVVGQMTKGNNLALCVSRKIDKEMWEDVLITNLLADVHSASSQTYIFPLWLYNLEKEPQNQLIPSTQPESKTSNIKKEVIDLLSSSYKKSVSPEEIFYYIYAVLYSNIYRQKYLEFLKIDFPRIPFTKDYKLFKELSEIGKRLADLHLLKSDLLNNTSSRFEGNDSGLVKKVFYDSEEKRVYINESQYFTNVEPEIWNYFIGGYQVLNKWLKDRKGKYLTDEEIKTYIKIIEALKQTIKIQEKIDKLYPKVENNLITDG